MTSSEARSVRGRRAPLAERRAAMEVERYRAAQLALFDELEGGHTPSSIVPLRATYLNAATCLTLIHLLAGELSARIDREIVQRLHAVESRHHWYPAGDLHLTIKNIQSARPGRVHSGDMVAAASAAIARACRGIAPLAFDILGPVCLPTSIVLRALGTPAHRDAVRSLDRELSASGIRDDKVYASTEVFLGNITVCRFTQPPSQALVEAVRGIRDRPIDRCTVSAVCLVQCDEVCSAESRRVLAQYRLAG